MGSETSFDILASGVFDREHVIVHWLQQRRRTSPEIERLIEEAWNARLQEARRLGKLLYPGRLSRLIGHRTIGDALHLDLGPTDFRELVGTNLSHPEWFYSPGPDFLANAVGVHAAVISADARIIIFRRSDLVTEAPGCYDVCGGHLELDFDLIGGIPDPFAAIAREIQEEMSIAPADLDNTTCLGLVRNARTFKPDVIFAVRTKRTAEQLLNVGLADEHIEARSIDADAHSVGEFLARHGEKTAPAGAAVLAILCRSELRPSP